MKEIDDSADKVKEVNYEEIQAAPYYLSGNYRDTGCIFLNLPPTVIWLGVASRLHDHPYWRNHQLSGSISVET
ncbi:hypothetical protein [Paenibacillus sp. YPG26]|uniref:hypothetical protein n=1 Tax=Paenibacillus sp. YPG26 TaxID=2878915 RepID=UPI00203C28BE|nr:hypothetical protein [Paenibacillus sp. YPG26]USB33919.1 hypothetical protein LDO05_03610 [Paenibacillus sp. YPG26]